MDDYALQQELEALAGNAYNHPEEHEEPRFEPMGITIGRWQKLFGLSSDEAVDRIMDHRNNLTRTRVTEDHWDLIRAEKESEGYDKEAYEFELEMQRKKAVLPDLVPTERKSSSAITYFVELTGPLSTAEKVQHAANLDDPPTVVDGYSAEDGRDVSLCCVDGQAKAAILKWVGSEGAGFEPTILVDPRSLRR